MRAEYVKWSPTDVTKQLSNIGLGMYSENFVRHEIYGEVLPMLTDKHFKELGVKFIGHRLALTRFIKSLTPVNTNNKNNNLDPGVRKNNTTKSTNQKTSSKRNEYDDQRSDDSASSHASDLWRKKNITNRNRDTDSNYGKKSNKVGGKNNYNYNDYEDDEYIYSSSKQKMNEYDRGKASNKNNDTDREDYYVQKKTAADSSKYASKKNYVDEEEYGSKAYRGNGRNNYDDEYKMYGAKGATRTNNYDEDEDYMPKRGNPAKKGYYAEDQTSKKPSNKGYYEDEECDYYEANTGYSQGNRQPPRKTSKSNYNGYGEDEFYKEQSSRTFSKQNQKASMKNTYGTKVNKGYYEDDAEEEDFGDYGKPTRSKAQTSPMNDDGGSNLVQCRVCGRKFGQDRIAVHEEICERNFKKPTKVFDSRKMRLQGTDAAQYFGKSDDTEVKKTKEINGVPKYKIAHDQLISSLRTARQFSNYEKAISEGKHAKPPDMGKNDMAYDDRVECQYCGRRFGEDALKRHINTCQSLNGKANARRPAKRF